MTDGKTACLVQTSNGWLSFHHPVHIVQAHTPGDVRRVIDDTEAIARARGLYAVGFVCYEAAEAFALPVRPSSGDLPLAWFAFFEPERVGRLAGLDEACPPAAYTVGSRTPSLDRESFSRAFSSIREHIGAGNTYQVNFTWRLRAPFGGDARRFFADLQAAQQGRYGAFIDTGRVAICSASPELFVRRDPLPPSASDGAARYALLAKPMKGTARRGRFAREDLQVAERLRASVKERAENVMIVDMVRNDLGRVAEIGSVDVPALFALERYPNVWQMTSTVRATSGASLGEIMAAAFPSASVTGAPKHRTMAIIEELEGEPRGMYTGAIGFIAPDGAAQFNVAIRTAVVDREAGALEFGVGSAVLWDSDPDREYDECLLKGSILAGPPEPFSLLETLRWTPADGFFLLQRHLDRLMESAGYFGFPCSREAVCAALEREIDGADRPLRVRLLVASDGAVCVEHVALEPDERVVRVGLARTPVDPSDPFLFHKTTNRRTYDVARLPGLDDTLLWTPDGDLTESTIANLVVEVDGRRVTPPVACGLLPGTFRAELLAAGEIVEGRVRVEDLRRASQVWLVNSVQGWRRAVLD